VPPASEDRRVLLAGTGHVAGALESATEVELRVHVRERILEQEAVGRGPPEERDGVRRSRRQEEGVAGGGVRVEDPRARPLAAPRKPEPAVARQSRNRVAGLLRSARGSRPGVDPGDGSRRAGPKVPIGPGVAARLERGARLAQDPEDRRQTARQLGTLDEKVDASAR
jgi:hypothetical protein